MVATAAFSPLPLLPPQVLFKLLLGSAKFGEAALFLSVLGVFNLLFITCIPVILYFTKVEYWTPFTAIPWGNLCGFAVLLLSKWHAAAGTPLWSPVAPWPWGRKLEACYPYPLCFSRSLFHKGSPGEDDPGS